MKILLFHLQLGWLIYSGRPARAHFGNPNFPSENQKQKTKTVQHIFMSYLASIIMSYSWTMHLDNVVES